MVQKTVLTTLLITLIYSTVVRQLPRSLDTQQHLWNLNVAKAQGYLYDQRDLSHKCVVVGSSLSARLVEDSLPDSFINLAMGGQSLFDGLNVVERRNEKPRMILIETNAVFRRSNPDFEESLFSPFSYYLKKYLPAFRAEHQPVGVVKGLTMRVVELLRNSGSIQKESPSGQAPVNEKIFTLKKADQSTRPDYQTLEAAFKDLKIIVKRLGEQGVEIIFFEMPIEPGWRALARPTAIRRQFYAAFPPDQYTYIHLPGSRAYQTTDGLHLNRPSAARFTSYLRQEVEQRLSTDEGRQSSARALP